MSFEITNIAYDPQRQLPKMNYFHKKHIDNDQSGAKFQVSTPYIISFELNVYAKQQDDALQIVEQILPYFAPQYTVPVKPIEDYPDIVEDVPDELLPALFAYVAVLDPVRRFQRRRGFLQSAHPVGNAHEGRTGIEHAGI